MRNFEYIKLPIKCTLGHSAAVRTDGSDLKPNGDNVVGNIVLHHSRRAVNGFQKREHLETGYSRPQRL